MPVETKIQSRRDTAANWTTANPVLAAGELGFETNTTKFKIGDGTTAWASLNYYVSSASPALTGTPTAPTASDGTNTTQIATMASKPWNTAWGKVASAKVTTSNTSITLEVVKSTTLALAFSKPITLA